MNEETIDKDLSERGRRFRNRKNPALTGFFLIIIGILLMAKTAGVPFPSWFFTWPMILIALGIYSGIQHRFKGGAWFVFLIVGGVFLVDRVVDSIYLRPYLWPSLFIVVGIFFIVRPRSYKCQNRSNKNNNEAKDYNYSLLADTGAEETTMGAKSNEINITAILGGIKRNILSKDFKGGNLVAFMGGTEVNLTQADFTGRVVIESFNMFGGTKLIVPPTWDVQSEVVTIFGGVDDKRPPAIIHDQSKVIQLEGTCIFGGIEIKSF